MLFNNWQYKASCVLRSLISVEFHATRITFSNSDTISIENENLLLETINCKKLLRKFEEKKNIDIKIKEEWIKSVQNEYQNSANLSAYLLQKLYSENTFVELAENTEMKLKEIAEWIIRY